MPTGGVTILQTHSFVKHYMGVRLHRTRSLRHGSLCNPVDSSLERSVFVYVPSTAGFGTRTPHNRATSLGIGEPSSYMCKL